MSVFVADATLRAARDRAARFPLTAAERERWQEVAAYAAARRPDPGPERAAILRERLGMNGGAGDGAVLEAAGQMLADAVTGDAAVTGLTRQVQALCRHWLDEDVKAAAPLLDLFTGHHRDPEGGPPAPDPGLVTRLADWLARQAGPGARIEDARVISGGFSRLMLDVHWTPGDQASRRAADRGSPQAGAPGLGSPQAGKPKSGDHETGGRVVVRIEQDGMFGTEGRREAAVMRALRARGYPVPAIIWEEPDPAVLGHPFFVMEHVAGSPRTDDEGLGDMLRSLAALHGLGTETVDQVAELDGLPPGSAPDKVIAAQLRHWQEVYRSAVRNPIPLLDQGFAWLRTNLPATGPPVIVHGDPGPGNALADSAGVAAVIDWEFAHAGDAAEDWAYLALIRGRRLGTPEDWKARLAATVGVRYDEPAWRAWEAFNSVKGASVNLTALDVFGRTARPTPDLLAIGVAVHLRFLSRAVDLMTGP